MRNNYSESKSKVVKEAIRLFNEKGYQNVSVSEICNAAGIYRSTFYQIFSCKEDILSALFSDALNKLEISPLKLFNAENDLDRISIISNSLIDIYTEMGPQTTGYLYILEIEKGAEGIISSTISTLGKWDQLLVNCQKLGIARNMSDPAALSKIIIHYGWQLVFEWCVMNGEFDIYERARQALENILDVPEKYRKSGHAV